ncbi:MAG: hypothetical protein V4691_03365 [Pseudomonadota bacterium]
MPFNEFRNVDRNNYRNATNNMNNNRGRRWQNAQNDQRNPQMPDFNRNRQDNQVDQRRTNQNNQRTQRPTYQNVRDDSLWAGFKNKNWNRGWNQNWNPGWNQNNNQGWRQSPIYNPHRGFHTYGIDFNRLRYQNYGFYENNNQYIFLQDASGIYMNYGGTRRYFDAEPVGPGLFQIWGPDGSTYIVRVVQDLGYTYGNYNMPWNNRRNVNIDYNARWNNRGNFNAGYRNWDFGVNWRRGNWNINVGRRGFA